MSATPASIRKSIREAVRTLLDAVPSLGTVETGKHALPSGAEDVPLTRVRTSATTPETDNASESDLQITLEVVHFNAALPGDATSIDDKLDAASGLIYTALYQDGKQTLGGLCYHILPGPQVQSIADESETLLGVTLDTYTLICPFPKNTPPIPEEE